MSDPEFIDLGDGWFQRGDIISRFDGQSLTVLNFRVRDTQTLTVDHVPDWATPTDFIEQRGSRTFFVSQIQIPRWRHLLNRTMTWWRGL